MKKIQFSLDEAKHQRAKILLAKKGISWQTFCNNAVDAVLSEDSDSWGIPLHEMAFDRDSFKNKIQEKLAGALDEYAFILTASANGETKWVDHKTTEVERLLKEIEIVMLLDIKGKWDKRTAALEAINYFTNSADSLIRRAKKTFKTYYKKQPTKELDKKDITSFLDKIRKIVRTADISY